jgi:hypothetical protein
MSQNKRFDLPDRRRPRKERNNPITPLPLPTRNTDPLQKAELLKNIGLSYEETGEHRAIPSASMIRQSVYRSKADLPPTVLLFCAVRAHILQQNDRKPPRELYVCQQLYHAVKADIELQSSEIWDGKYKFVMYDRSDPVSIPVGVDILIHQSVPADTVICIH